MKRVELKQKSPEFIDLTKVKASTRLCDIDGCCEAGEYRAPKNRSLNDYYKFCYAHVSDYNRAWNFFDGMSDADVQNSMYSSLFGDRPTWRYTSFGDLEEKLRNNAYGFRDYMEAEREKKEQERARAAVAPNTPEGEAMAIMELLPPVTLEGIKARYKELAKQFHPDRNPDNPEAEEKLKDINMAYTVLRLAYQKYENMAEK